MKKFVLIASLVAAAALTACGKKEDVAPAVVTPPAAPAVEPAAPGAMSPTPAPGATMATPSVDAPKDAASAPK